MHADAYGWACVHHDDGVTAGANENAGAASEYAYLYVPLTEGGNSYANWFEIPYSGAGLNSVTIGNTGSSSITLSDPVFFLSPTQIPLDNLNYSDVPPPPGTTNVPQFEGVTIDPNGSMTFDVPEPASVLFFGSGLAALGVARRRRRRRGA
jgi:hypothetical protein